MILPPATLGLLGGGQLGRYFVIAAHELGYRVIVLDPDPDCVAGRIGDEHVAASYDDQAALDHLANRCAAVTTEFESVPAQALSYLARHIPVRPSPEAVAICQNRGDEKAFLKSRGFPHVPYASICGEEDAMSAPTDLFPGILKVARFGYDGKGQARVKGKDDALSAFRQFGGEPCVLEREISLECEVSLVLARDEGGKVECFPMAFNHHRQGILDHSFIPARGVTGRLADTARGIAHDIAAGMDYVGTLAVEFFVVEGELLVNELAPRPHNSGHYTLDACITNQYEQQVRALCGLPLGDAGHHSAAMMVNLLGDLWYPGGARCAREPDWHKLQSVSHLKLHLYGKHGVRPGRKMGHFTVLGEDSEIVREKAMAARTAIGIC